jgi:hypothetical protein
MPARHVCLALCIALGVVGCGGSGDDRPDLPAAAPPSESPVTTPAPAEPAPASATTATRTERSLSLAERQRTRITAQAADTAAAIRRWDQQLLGCTGASGDEDDADATCTHAAWEQLVDQVEIEMYYLLEHLRAMPRGPCHDALAAENDILRAFWHGAAPLDLAWLDEQQRPPSHFDLETAVDLVRPVPGRIREAVTTVCA